MPENETRKQLFIEYRLVPLDRRTGEPCADVEEIATQFIIDIDALARTMMRVRGGADWQAPQLPQSEIQCQAHSTAEAMGEMYGADVYYRFYVPPCVPGVRPEWTVSKSLWKPGSIS